MSAVCSWPDLVISQNNNGSKSEGQRQEKARKADTEGGGRSNKIQSSMPEKGRKCSMRGKFRN